MATARNDLLTVALTNAAAGVCIAVGFAHAELAVWWQEQRAMLVVLATAALILSFAGAAVPQHLPIPRMRFLSTLGHVIAGLVLGVAFVSVVGVATQIAADVTPWGLLVYFFFGALALGAYFAVVPPKRGRRDG